MHGSCVGGCGQETEESARARAAYNKRMQELEVGGGGALSTRLSRSTFCSC